MSPITSWCLELFLPRCRVFHFPLLNFIRLLSAHFSSLKPAEVLLDVSATLASFMYYASLLWVRSAPSSRSLMKVLNGTGPSADHRGAPSVTGIQLDFVQSSLSSGPRHSVSSAPHCLIIQPIYQQLVCEDLIGDSVKDLPQSPYRQIPTAFSLHCKPAPHREDKLAVGWESKKV